MNSHGFCLQRSSIISLLTKSWTNCMWSIDQNKLFIFIDTKLIKEIKLNSNHELSEITNKDYNKYGNIYKFSLVYRDGIEKITEVIFGSQNENDINNLYIKLNNILNDNENNSL